MDDLELNMQNVTFDNSVLIVYDEKYVPLLTAMAVMVARELARDEEADMGDKGKLIKLAEISGVWYSTGEVYSPLDVKLTKDDILRLEEMRKCR